MKENPQGTMMKRRGCHGLSLRGWWKKNRTRQCKEQKLEGKTKKGIRVKILKDRPGELQYTIIAGS